MRGVSAPPLSTDAVPPINAGIKGFAIKLAVACFGLDTNELTSLGILEISLPKPLIACSVL